MVYSDIGNKLYCLKISETLIAQNKKKLIVIIARVHPGESNSSYICEGLINQLLKKSPYISYLLKKFIFLIFPMINPDGVAGGMYRRTMESFDLNRQWENPDEKLHPTLFTTKEYISKFAENVPLYAMFDLHGHSSQKNSFLYGCEYSPYEQDYVAKNHSIKEFMKLLAKSCCYFSYIQSSLKITKDKEGTARVVFRRQFEIDKTFTLETSMFGSDLNRIENANMYFTVESLWEIGESLLRCIALDELGCKYPNVNEKIDDEYMNKYMRSLKKPKKQKYRVKFTNRSRINIIDSVNASKLDLKINTTIEKAPFHSSVVALHFTKKPLTLSKVDDSISKASIPSLEDSLPSIKLPSSKPARARICSLHEKISHHHLRNYDISIHREPNRSTIMPMEQVSIIPNSIKPPRYGRCSVDKYGISSFTKIIKDDVPSYYNTREEKGNIITQHKFSSKLIQNIKQSIMPKAKDDS